MQKPKPVPPKPAQVGRGVSPRLPGVPAPVNKPVPAFKVPAPKAPASTKNADAAKKAALQKKLATMNTMNKGK